MSRSTAKATLDQRVGDPETKWLTPARLKETVDVVYDDVAAASISLLDYATGDGVTDDTAGIRSALAALANGMTLVVPSGYTFNHTDDLYVIGLTNITVTGGGTIAHVSDADSTGGLRFEDCYDVTVENLTLTSTATTRRTGDYSHRLFLYQCGSVHVRDITINGSAAAGILLDTTSGFVIERCTISHTLADSLHMTHETNNGVVDSIVSDYSGDDGVAVVSYDSRPTRVRDIVVSNVTVTNQLWGRGISVVGGLNIHYSDCTITGSSAAGIYVAAESSFSTQGVNDCSFTNITLDDCVRQASDTPALRPRPAEAALKQGAVTVWRGRLDPYTLTDVTMTGITITNTQVDAYNDVQLVCYDATYKQPERLDFINFDITTVHTPLDDTVVELSKYNTKNWIVNAVAQADHIGWVSATASPILSSGGSMSGALGLASTAPVGTTDATPKWYVDKVARGNGVLFGALYTVIPFTSTPSITVNGQVCIEDQTGGVWKVLAQRVMSDGTNVLSNFTNIEAGGYSTYYITLTHEDGLSVTFAPNTTAHLSEPYNGTAWFATVVRGDPATFPTSGKVNFTITLKPVLPSTVTATNVDLTGRVTVTSGTDYSWMYPTYMRVGDGTNQTNIYPTYISSTVAYLSNVEVSGATTISFDTAARNAVKSGALSIVRNGSTSAHSIITAYPTAADEAAGTNAYFELRGDGALKIGSAVNSSDAVTKGQIKTIVAASADFADFQTRMAAW